LSLRKNNEGRQLLKGLHIGRTDVEAAQFELGDHVPGQDAQRTSAASLIAHGRLDASEIVSTTAYADSDIVYSFDGDWASDAYWADVAPEWFAEFGPYDYFSRFERERRTLSEDLRWISASTAADDGHGWVLGVYALRLDEDNRQQDDFAEEPFRLLDSTYSATNLAAYGEFEWRLHRVVCCRRGCESRSA
jgi:hypothetical protein